MLEDLLIIEDPDKKLFRCPLTEKRVLVGRDPSCSIVFPDKSVSRKHLEIQQREGQYFALALSHGNPVIVVFNSEDVDILSAGSTEDKGRALKHGDILKLGKYNIHCWLNTTQTRFRMKSVEELPWFQLSEDFDQDPESTNILTPEQTRRLLQSDRRFVNATIEGEEESWALGPEGLTFGRTGDIQILGWRSAAIVAEIRWEGSVHCLVPKEGWLAIRINQYTIRESTELRDEDIFFIGAHRFVYRVQSGL